MISPILILQAQKLLKARYWYKYTAHVCPMCGTAGISKERKPYPKPSAYLDRHEVIEIYDNCQGAL